MIYEPSDKTSPEAVCDAAYNCGRDLNPNDRRAQWIDTLPADLRRDAVDAYHAGQSERYECEDW
jgi:hypothetical protein